MRWLRLAACILGVLALQAAIVPGAADDVEGSLDELLADVRERGMAKLQANDYPGAIAEFEKLHQYGADDPFLLKIHALALLKLGRQQEGLAMLGKVLQLAPTADHFQLRGTTRQLLGDLTGAVADFDSALALDRGRPKIWSNRGVAKMNLEDYAGAVADLGEALRLSPFYAIARFNRGIALHRMGRPQDALREYDLALALRPGWREVQLMRDSALSDMAGN